MQAHSPRQESCHRSSSPGGAYGNFLASYRRARSLANAAQEERAYRELWLQEQSVYTVEIAALLHDVQDWKYSQSESASRVAVQVKPQIADLGACSLACMLQEQPVLTLPDMQRYSFSSMCAVMRRGFWNPKVSVSRRRH